MKLLVIDDEPLVRRGIVSLIPFDELGIERVLQAGNGAKGLEIVKEEEPDIVLCDINMPKLNGLDFAKEVKANWPWIKIAIITGYDYFDYARQAVKIGVHDYVLKPVSKQGVYEIVAGIIGKIQEEGALKEVYKTLEKEMKDGGEAAKGYKEQIDKIIEEMLSSEDLSLTYLANQLGLNDNYLSTLFKKLYDVPFSEYVLSKRLDKSKRLLLATDLKNYEVAERVGIYDPNYFSTLFRKRFGDSPNKYKKKYRK